MFKQDVVLTVKGHPEADIRQVNQTLKYEGESES